MSPRFPMSVVQDNIVRATTDAVVNPANVWLQNGAGVAGALQAALGGPQGRWQRDCTKHTQNYGALAAGPKRCDVHVYETAPEDNAGFRFVLSVVGPRYGDYADPMNMTKHLRVAIRAAFQTALACQAKSVAIPAISSGLFGVSVQTVAQELVRVGGEFCSRLDIVFLNYDEPTCNEMRRALRAYYKEQDGE